MANATQTTYAIVRTAQVTGQAIDTVTFGYAGKAANAVMSVISSAPENADTQVRRAVRNGTGSQAVGQDLGLVAGAVVEFLGPKKVTQTIQLATKVLPATKLVVVSKNFEALGVEGVVASKAGKSHLAGLDLAQGSLLPKAKKNPQPWTIREGQEWKEKIYGTAQKTKTDGHKFRAYRQAIQEAKVPNIVKVHLDHGYNRATGEQIKSNRRPDVLTVDKSGKVNAYEVPSKSDKPKELIRRNQEAINKLPEARRGNIELVKITDEKKK